MIQCFFTYRLHSIHKKQIISPENIENSLFMHKLAFYRCMRFPCNVHMTDNHNLIKEAKQNNKLTCGDGEKEKESKLSGKKSIILMEFQHIRTH